MNRYFDTKLGMYKGVYTFLVDNSVTLTAANIPIIITYKGSLAAKIDAIRTTSEEAGKYIKGITLKKSDAEDKAINIAVAVAGILFSYAKDWDNIALSDEMKNISASTLKAKKDEEAINYLYNVLYKAQEISTVTPPASNPLIPYGLRPDISNVGNPDFEPGTLTQLKAAISKYTSLTAAPRSGINERKTYNGVLKNLYKETDDLLERMDKVIKSMKDVFPLFYTGYKNARNIVDPLKKHTKIAGSIIDKNGQPIPMVNITAAALSESDTIYQGITDYQGIYHINTPKFRSLYRIQYSRFGYKDLHKAEVVVRLGKTTEIDIIMDPDL